MKKRLGIFFNGAPEIEAIYSTAKRLCERDEVDLKAFVPSGYLKREPRARALLDELDCPLVRAPNFALKRAHGWWFRGLDAIVVLSDPNNDQSVYRYRHEAAAAVGLPLIFVQHGVLQGGLNLLLPGMDAREYASSLILTFGSMQNMRQHYTPKTMDRMQQVGFLKKFPYQLQKPGPELRQLLDGFARRIVMCHSFRWSHDRFAVDAAMQFFDMLEASAERHPDTLFILRSHRGIAKDEIRQREAELCSRANVIASYAKSGLFAGWSLYDILGSVDLLVSHASTAILDGLYAGVPSAVLAETGDEDWFPGLPSIETEESLSAFLTQAQIEDQVFQDTLARFGNFESNIERCCEAIEDFMASL